jgi:hypothetical protein
MFDMAMFHTVCTIYADILVMTDRAIAAATDAATRDPICVATAPQFVLPMSSQDDAICLAVSAAIRAGGGSAE